jgi:GDP-L-fucose synthase
VNLPGSEEITMKKLAEMIAKLAKFKGRIEFDPTRPDGQPKRLVDGTRARQMLGWAPETRLQEGLGETMEWYLNLRRKAAPI